MEAVAFFLFFFFFFLLFVFLDGWSSLQFWSSGMLMKMSEQAKQANR